MVKNYFFLKKTWNFQVLWNFLGVKILLIKFGDILLPEQGVLFRFGHPFFRMKEKVFEFRVPTL